MNIARTSRICAMICIIAASTCAQQRQPEPLAPVEVKKGVFMFKGGDGANTGCIIGDDRIIAIDGKMTVESARTMTSETAKISRAPLSALILTHSDQDHVNGLGGFPAGIQLIAHENTLAHMKKASVADALLPTVTFNDRLSLYYMLDGKRMQVEVLHFGPAHTDGDAVVFLPDARTAFVGDLLFLSRDPLIHLAKNGTSFGLVKVLRVLLSLDADMYIAGHDAPATKDDIRTLLRSIEEKQAQIHKMVNEGKSLDEVKQFFQIDPAKPGSRFMSLAEVIFRELTKQ